MNPLFTPQDLAIRFALAFVASALIGLNRGEHGSEAGLRTTLLVGLSSTAAMLLANALLGTTGKAPDSFVNFDVMRLPLGILTGIGFIGAGAILRRGGIVHGVTTAATLWFVTVMGLGFGAGQLGLGLAMLGLGMVVLGGLKWIERRLKCRWIASLTLVVDGERPTDGEFTTRLLREGYEVTRWAIQRRETERRIQCEVRWLARKPALQTPKVVEELVSFPNVRKVSWVPRQ